MYDRHDYVTVQPFCLDLTEVTAAAYGACVRSGGCTADHPGQATPDGKGYGRDTTCNYGVAARAGHPMNCVDWTQSNAFCRARGARLPTEEEWEWAARGGPERRRYPWGDDEPHDQACWSGGSTEQTGTCTVGSHPAGDARGGIHDLAGNVYEWTSSVFGAFSRVYRGGSWNLVDDTLLRSGCRDGITPAYRSGTLGFRCAQ
jgi:formylglycine-generating enzyme